jgi:hypothetical protein
MNTENLTRNNLKFKPHKQSRQFSQARNEARSPLRAKKLDLWDQAEKEKLPYLQIQSVPVKKRVNAKEIRYELWIYPHAVRACGGQFTGHEAHKICQAVKGWDWVLDENNRPHCLPELEALIDNIVERSVGGEA